MKLFDTHCHLDLPAFDDDRQTVIDQAQAAHVGHFLVPGTNRPSWPMIDQLCRLQQDVFPAYGLHPVWLNDHKETDIEALGDWLTAHAALAVGEIGLDFQLASFDKKRQIDLFEKQLSIAQDMSLPVILHVRKAHDQVLNCLRKFQLHGGICHAFNGSLQQARKYRALSFKFGFGGMLTYERSTRLRRLAAELPLDSIVLETDSPDMTGASHQYQRNSPAYLPEVLQSLAQVRRMDENEVAEITTSNAFAVLNLSPLA